MGDVERARHLKPMPKNAPGAVELRFLLAVAEALQERPRRLALLGASHGNWQSSCAERASSGAWPTASHTQRGLSHIKSPQPHPPAAPVPTKGGEPGGNRLIAGRLIRLAPERRPSRAVGLGGSINYFCCVVQPHVITVRGAVPRPRRQRRMASVRRASARRPLSHTSYVRRPH